MFVKNTQNKDIEMTSFEGFVFSIPPGVSWIWDKLGEHLLKNVYRVESSGGIDKYGNDNGHGLPPLFESNKKEWIKGGKKLTAVKRFVLNSKYMGRDAVIDIARSRGVDQDRIMQYLTDKRIEKDEIEKDINDLPVPEEIRYPKELNEDNNNEELNEDNNNEE